MKFTKHLASLLNEEDSFHALDSTLEKTYVLSNSGQWFKDACSTTETRRWLEQIIQAGFVIHMVVGIHTVSKPRSSKDKVIVAIQYRKVVFGCLLGRDVDSASLQRGRNIWQPTLITKGSEEAWKSQDDHFVEVTLQRVTSEVYLADEEYFITIGKLGTAILLGLLNREPRDYRLVNGVQQEELRLARILACVKSKESAERLESAAYDHKDLVTVFVGEVVQAINEADVVILACKSSQFRAVLGAPGTAKALESKIILSVLGGVTKEKLAECIDGGSSTILRVMPNIAASLGESVTLIEKPTSTSQADALELAQALFLAVGAVHVVPSSQIEVGAVVTASSPAFFASILEAVANSLAKQGFSDRLAQDLAAGAMRSAAALSLSGKSPGETIQQIATVGGSTEKGLKVLEETQVGAGVTRAVEKTLEAAKGLGDIVIRSD